MKKLFQGAVVCLVLLSLNLQLSTVLAQTTAFTYQGRLNDGGGPATGNYDLRFALYDAVTNGTQQGVLVTNSATPVSNGLFTVTVDFGNQFPGTNRWLEIAVRTNGASVFTNLIPRQQLTSTPYAVQSLNAGFAVNAASAINATFATTATTANTATSATSATTAVTAGNFSGPLGGDVTGTQSATSVAQVGGQSAGNVASGAQAANLATSANNINTIVKRDGSGNFSAGTITATLAGNATSATTATTANNFSGSLAGNVTGTQGATVVASVGGQSAANVASGASAANSAAILDTPSTIVKRDVNGSFLAGQITATNFTGNGDGLTNLQAGALLGIVPDVRLSPNIPRLNGTNIFTGTNTFVGVLIATNTGTVISGSLSGNATSATTAATATSFTGSLAGDVTGTQSATAVASVGGQTAANVSSGAVAANAATTANTANTIVKRGATGNFSAGTISANGFNGDGSGVSNVVGTLPWQVVSGTAKQTQPNKGYLATNDTLVTITLPTAPAIGDVVRVTGTGTNGWILAQNASQSILCSILSGAPNLTGFPNTVVTPVETNRNWSSVAISSDASTIIALDYGGHIHTSTDSGQTWAVHANARNWISVACSSSGTRAVAADFQGQLYTSTDSGSTWTARDSNRWWTAVAYPGNGYLFAGESSPGPIYISFDTGTNWSSFASGGGSWVGIACSSTPNDIYAASSLGNIIASHDGGSTWTNTVGVTGTWSSIDCSANGSNVVACINGGHIYTSTDRGFHFTSRDSVRGWKAVSGSADGSIVIAADGAPGYLYISTNYGVNWSAQTSGPSTNWSSVACTPDGSKFVATVSGGQIYTGQVYLSSDATTVGATGYLMGSQYSSIELQYIGNGQFVPISYIGTFQPF